MSPRVEGSEHGAAGVGFPGEFLQALTVGTAGADRFQEHAEQAAGVLVGEAAGVDGGQGERHLGEKRNRV
jgi:hypothetical protein